MNIKGLIICGQPAKKVRDALKKAGGKRNVFSTTEFLRNYRIGNYDQSEDFDKYYAAWSNAANDALKYLLNEGFIEEIKENSDSPLSFTEKKWRLTLKGSGFTNASAQKKIPRRKALVKLLEFLRRVIEIRGKEEFLFIVDEVVLFGSLLDDQKTEVSDIDVAIRLRERFYQDRNEYLKQVSERARILGANDNHNLIRAGFACSNDVLRYLKNRQPIYSIHGLDSEAVLENDIPRLTIYKFDNANSMEAAIKLCKEQIPDIKTKINLMNQNN